MKSILAILLGWSAASLAFAQSGNAKQSPRKAPPTAADWAALAKLPDLTGVWEAGLGGGGGGRAARGDAAQAGGAQGAPGRAGAKGRGRGGAPAPSLTPAYAAKAQALAATRRGDGETANCLPPGMPTIMNQPYPMEFLLTPGLVTIVIEAYSQVRHIYTDGRPLPEDPDPNFYGTSVGHWEGDTLVAESVGFAQVARGLSFPYSDKMKILERFKLTDPDTMSIETTIVDPEALTGPYSMGARTLRRHRNWTIAEYVCEENNRNFVDANGNGGVRLDNPGASPK
ncbi:MAG TPA: hypothetical protein VIY49_18935 [Bryobacteraceae bacterium]